MTYNVFGGTLNPTLLYAKSMESNYSQLIVKAIELIAETPKSIETDDWSNYLFYLY